MASTGNCYENTYVGLCTMVALRLYRPDQLRLAHGIVVNTRLHCEMGHAWVETADGRVVYDFTNLKRGVTSVYSELYYDVGQVSVLELVRYTPDQMTELLAAFDHYGPWEGRCYDPNRKVGEPVLPNAPRPTGATRPGVVAP